MIAIVRIGKHSTCLAESAFVAATHACSLAVDRYLCTGFTCLGPFSRLLVLRGIE